MIPLMSVTRNFFMGREPVKGIWPFRYVDFERCDQVTREEMRRIGIDVRDPTRRSAPFRAASANASPSRAPSISGPRC